VTANCIAPGFIATAMTDRLNDKQREAILAAFRQGGSAQGGMWRRGGLSRFGRSRLHHRATLHVMAGWQ